MRWRVMALLLLVLWAPPGWGAGNGPSFSASPAMVSFGGILWMSNPQPVNVQLANTGGGELELAALTLGDTTDFALADLPVLPNVLSAGASQSVQVLFTPSAQMSFMTTLTVGYYLLPDTTDLQIATIPLSGAAGLPAIGVPPALTLQSVRVGRASASQYVTINNTGLANLTVSGASFSGGTAGEFVVDSPPAPAMPLLVPPGGAQDLYMHYTPAAPGARSATLTVTSDDPANPSAMVQVSGYGLVAEYSNPTHSLDFTATLGTCTMAQDIVIANGGDDTLNITGLTFGGANGSSFQTTVTAPLVVPGGGTLAIPVQFCPQDAGTLSGSLVISADVSPGFTDTVTLFGDAAGPKLSGSATALVFPPTSVGAQSAPQELVVTNDGSLPLGGFVVLLTGDDPAEFSAPTSATLPPATLLPGASFTLQVSFDPLSAGSRDADLAVNAPGLIDPVQVSLRGNGTPVSVSCDPTTLDFDTVSIGSSASRTVLCTNTANTPIDLDALFDNFTSDWSVSPGGSLTIPAADGAAGSLALTVSFAPADVGMRSADLLLTGQGTDGLVLATIAVNGSGQMGTGEGSSGAGGCRMAARGPGAQGAWTLALLLLVGLGLGRRKFFATPG